MKKIILMIIILLSLCVNVSIAGEEKYLQKYSDVPTWHWAYETINKLSAEGIISGYPDGSFLPENSITRAEATKLLMLSLKENGVFNKGINVCEDVKSSHWASKYIINGKNYVKLYDNGLFKPEQNITRLEFANAVSEALESVIISTDANTTNIELKDISNLDERSINNIKFLLKIGIINGYEDNTFRPHNTLTRAETCKMLSLALIYKEKEINNALSDTVSWYKCNSINGFHSPVLYDTKGNIKLYTGTATDLYYNGEHFVKANKNIKTVKQEKLYTSDGLIWDVRWFGDDVIEYMYTNGKHVIINHYQEKEYEFDSEFIIEYDVLKILEELFPYIEYRFVLENNNMYCYKYEKNTEKCKEGSLISNSYIDSNGIVKVNVKDLKTIIWAEEVNGNNQSDVIDIIKNSNGQLRVVDIIYENGKYLVKAELLKDIIISEEQYLKMILEGYIYINDNKYLYENFQTYSEIIYEEKYKNFDDNYKINVGYEIISKDEGYYFSREIGGYWNNINYVDKEISIYLNENTKVEECLFEEDYDGRIKTLKENNNVIDYLLLYSENGGIYLYNDHF